MPSLREITGIFLGEKIAFGNPDKGEVRVIIGRVETKEGEEVVIKGPAEIGELSRGMLYRFYGRIKTHHKHGDQFVFDSFVTEKPAGEEAVVTYLMQCDGIGQVKAGKLFAQFGEDAVRMLRERPLEAASIAGLKGDDALAAAEMLQEMALVEKTTLEIYGLLHGRGFFRFKKLVKDLIYKYGANAARQIRRNPYLLMAFPGIGFGKADKLYMEFAPKETREAIAYAARLKRQALCAWYSLSSQSEGDTWYPLWVVKQFLFQKIAGTVVQLEKAIKLALRHGMICERVERGQRWFAEASKANAEGRVAKFIAQAEAEEPHWPDLNALRVSLGPDGKHQFDELSKALTGTICVLTGSPGTGKTFSTAAIIKLVMGMGYTVAACAPTGKAAVRLTEALNNNGVSLRATTIHGLLGVESNEDGEWGFHYCESDPLPYDYVFIDEASMIDAGIKASLLAARATGTHYLFVGDANQLAPVGHGAPLRDMILAPVPAGTLTEIRRNSGMIVKACAEIRDHKRFRAAKAADIETGDNLVLLERDNPTDQIATLEALMNHFAASGKYDPVWDVQIIVAVNKKSPLGRKPLNVMLQKLLNPNGQSVAGNPFRIGDKLINTKNGWVPALDPQHPLCNEKGQLYVANGEQGEVLDVDVGRTLVRLTAPDRDVVIPRSTKSDEETETRTDTASENDDSDDTGTGCHWELGYAISCHRSQGSEWKVVIILADEYGGAKRVQSRQWLYTGISRGKVLCFVIGKQIVCDEMCKRDALFARKTFLVERIRAYRMGKLEQGPEITPAPKPWGEDVLSQILEGVV